MNMIAAGAIGGLAGGVAMSLAMELGRRTGTLHKTLTEDAEGWLDRVAHTRQHIGEGGTRGIEQANHLAAAAGFGVAYSFLRERARALPSWGLGMVYGAGLYVINIVGIAPLIGLTEGEHKAPTAVRAERFGLHLLYGVLTAVIAGELADEG